MARIILDPFLWEWDEALRGSAFNDFERAAKRRDVGMPTSSRRLPFPLNPVACLV